MDDNSKLSQSIREGIDACRPGRDDLTRSDLPELTEAAHAVKHNAQAAVHFARVAKSDLAFRSALYDVVVPQGLQSRLLQSLAASAPAHVAGVPVVTAPVPAENEAAVVQTAATNAPPTAGRSRLWFSLAAAASLLVGGSLLITWTLQPGDQVTLEKLADVWQGQLTNDWRPMASAPRGSALPVRLAVRPRGWQPIANYQGYRGIAYDLSRPRSAAVLFVATGAPPANLPNFPPQNITFSSGGKSVAVWRSGNQMCMLVFDGDERAYRSLIGTGQIPVACNVVAPTTWLNHSPAATCQHS